jgi:hypothetical protein
MITLNDFTLKIIFILLALVALALCIIFYQLGIHSYPSNSNVPKYIFEPWFVYTILIASIVGYCVIVISMKTINVGFAISSLVLLVCLVFCFIKTYYTLKEDVKNYTAIQIFAFNVWFNCIFLAINIVQNSNRFIYSLIALVPLVVLGALYNNVGGIIANQ